jgi:hypothetical protein
MARFGPWKHGGSPWKYHEFSDLWRTFDTGRSAGLSQRDQNGTFVPDEATPAPIVMRIGHLWLVAYFMFGLSGGSAPATAQLAQDMKLEDAGFVMRPADTAQKLERLRLLPPRKFAARTKAGQRYYLYPDPDYCKCVFVGDQRALNSFRDMRAGLPQPYVVGPGGVSAEHDMIYDMDADGVGVPEGDILDYGF